MQCHWLKLSEIDLFRERQKVIELTVTGNCARRALSTRQINPVIVSVFAHTEIIVVIGGGDG